MDFMLYVFRIDIILNSFYIENIHMRFENYSKELNSVVLYFDFI